MVLMCDLLLSSAMIAIGHFHDLAHKIRIKTELDPWLNITTLEI